LVGASNQTLLRELTVLPTSPAGFKGLLLRGGKGKGKKWRGREEKERGRNSYL